MKERQVHHSVDLDMTYTPVWPGQRGPDGRKRRSLALVFEDGTEYTWVEAMTVSHTGGSRDDLRALHAIKRAIGGRILPPPRPPRFWPPGKLQDGGSAGRSGIMPFAPTPYSTPSVAHLDENGRYRAPGGPAVEQTDLFNPLK